MAALRDDFDQAPWATIWKLSWPQMVMMVFHFLIGFVDVLVAGRIHSDVQASMGMITQLLFFFLVVAIAVANGSVAAISQSMGAGLSKRVLRYVGLVLELAVVLGALILVAGWPAKGLLMAALQVPGQLAPIMSYFLDVFLPLLPIYYLFIITNAIFRARKQVMVPLAAMIVVTSVNTFGDLGFGLGWFGLPAFGYKGLAWATFASVSAGALFNLCVLASRGLLRREAFPPWRWIRCAFPYLFKVAWPGGLMQVVWHSAYMVLFALVAGLPVGSVSALAGMTAGLRVESFLFLPGVAFNFTAAILVGQCLGMGRPDLARRYALRILALGVVSISVITGAVWLWVEEITAFIAPDASVQADAVRYLVYNMAAIPFTLVGMILGGALNGAGATLFNLASMGTASWLVRLPLAYVLGYLVFGRAEGIWIAMLCSQVFQAALSWYIFTYWNWPRFAMRSRKGRGTGEDDAQVRTHQPSPPGRV